MQTCFCCCFSFGCLPDLTVLFSCELTIAQGNQKNWNWKTSNSRSSSRHRKIVGKMLGQQKKMGEPPQALIFSCVFLFEKERKSCYIYVYIICFIFQGVAWCLKCDLWFFDLHVLSHFPVIFVMDFLFSEFFPQEKNNWVFVCALFFRKGFSFGSQVFLVFPKGLIMHLNWRLFNLNIMTIHCTFLDTP